MLKKTCLLSFSFRLNELRSVVLPPFIDFSKHTLLWRKKWCDLPFFNISVFYRLKISFSIVGSTGPICKISNFDFTLQLVFNKTRNGFVRAMRSSFIDRGSTSVTTQTFHYFIQRGWFSPFSMICESSFTTVWQGMFLSFLLDFTTYILLSYQHEIAKNSGLEERMGLYSFLEGNLM